MVGSEVTRHILASYESGAMMRACAWCNRLAVGEHWVFAPRATLAAIEASYTVSHTICPDCAAAAAPAAA
jgi:NMD protein affecting ribosome stability and mRNA decay